MKTRSDITPKCLETAFEVCIGAWIPICGVRWSEIYNRILVCLFVIELSVVRITLRFVITLWYLQTFLSYVINLMWSKPHFKTDKSESLYSFGKSFSKYCRLVAVGILHLSWRHIGCCWKKHLHLIVIRLCYFPLESGNKSCSMKGGRTDLWLLQRERIRVI